MKNQQKTENKTVRKYPKKLRITVSKRSPVAYDTDFFKWTKSQAVFLKKGDFEKLDMDNLAEEIESLGRSDKRALRSHLSILLMHLLKKQYQPNKLTNSWENSIRNARLEIRYIIEDSPSLKRFLPEFVEDAYSQARWNAAEETGLPESKFPEECPWTLQEIL